VAFVLTYRLELRDRPTWLFSVATVGASIWALAGIPSSIFRRLGTIPKDLPTHPF